VLRDIRFVHVIPSPGRSSTVGERGGSHRLLLGPCKPCCRQSCIRSRRPCWVSAWGSGKV
jgi:hypothetical protein